MFFSFLANFQVLQCSFLIFHIFKCFSPYSRSYSVHFLFSIFRMFLAILQILLCVFLIFHVFHCFSQYSKSYSLCFSFFIIFSFLAILKILECAFLIFHVFSVSCHIPHPTVWFSHFPWFSFFLPYSRSFSVISHIPCFWMFLAICEVIHYLCLIAHVFQFSHHNPGPPVCISHFPRFWLVKVRFLVKQYLCLIFHVFQFSHHIPGPTVFISYFPCFECFSPYSRT